jgi:hypothetical protein
MQAIAGTHSCLHGLVGPLPSQSSQAKRQRAVL